MATLIHRPIEGIANSDLECLCALKGENQHIEAQTYYQNPLAYKNAWYFLAPIQSESTDVGHLTDEAKTVALAADRFKQLDGEVNLAVVDLDVAVYETKLAIPVKRSQFFDMLDFKYYVPMSNNPDVNPFSSKIPLSQLSCIVAFPDVLRHASFST